MSNAVSQGSSNTPAAARHPGTKVVYRWAIWQAQHRCMRATIVGVFRKGDARLVVYEYSPSLCAVLKFMDVAPRVRDFREWRQPIRKIKEKLVTRGWIPETEGEVSNGAH